ncbi:MAG: AAA domain-containing protein [Bacteroidota bacterium]
MQSPINNIIKFYRDAYQFEYSTEKLTNFFSRSVAFPYFPKTFLIVSQEGYVLPVDSVWGKIVYDELLLSSSEQKLVAGTFFIKGKISVLGRSQKLFAPLYLHDVVLRFEQEVYTVELLPDTISLNPVAVNYLNSIHPEANYTYDDLADILLHDTHPFSFEGLVGITEKFKTRYPNINTDLIDRRIQSADRLANLELIADSRKQSYKNLLLPDVAIGMVDKPKKSKGVINELTALENTQLPSGGLLDQLFTEQPAKPSKLTDSGVDSNSYIVPTSLSEKQEAVLAAAARAPLSVVVGPPGTGKSYTIAALAIQAAHEGKKVLIASKNEQACQVIHQKINRDIGIKGISLDASKARYRISVGAKLRNIANGVGVKILDHAYYRRLYNEVLMLKSAISTKAKTILRKEAEELKWGNTLTTKRKGIITTIKKNIIAYRHRKQRPIWEMLDKLRREEETLKRKEKQLIKLTYQNRLYMLFGSYRQDLLRFEKAFQASKGNVVRDIFTSVDFSKVLVALPIWICKSGEVANIFPLEAELFDLLIIDEASQCDIASSIPLLYRAKSAVIVGDPQQLRHVSFLSRKKEALLRTKYGIQSTAIAYRDRSILDHVNDILPSGQQVLFLDEHYRSKPDIIAFSNQQFYGNELNIMTASPCSEKTRNVIIHQVEGSRTENGQNEVEADAIIAGMQKRIASEELLEGKSASSLGVISPFRTQVNLLKKKVKATFDTSVIKKHQIMVDTPFGFQGEERDVVFLSFTVDENTHPATFRFLDRSDVFNVSITRAKVAQEIYVSMLPAKMKEDLLLAHYLTHQYQPVFVPQHIEVYDAFAHQVMKFLERHEAGHLYLDRAIAGANLDIVIVQADRTLGIDLVGFPGEFQEQLSLSSLKRLERAGIEIFLLPFSTWYLDKLACQRALKKFIEH